jgi:hypothetical protein
MADTAKLLSMLKNGNVKINFTHWSTDAPLEVIASSTKTIKNQSDKSNTIVVFDTINDKYEDIRVSTITSFEEN